MHRVRDKLRPSAPQEARASGWELGGIGQAFLRDSSLRWKAHGGGIWVSDEQSRDSTMRLDSSMDMSSILGQTRSYIS